MASVMLLLQFSTLLKISVIMNSYYQFSVCWAPEAVVNFHLSLYLEAYFIDLFSYRDVLGFFPPTELHDACLFEASFSERKKLKEKKP